MAPNSSRHRHPVAAGSPALGQGTRAAKARARFVPRGFLSLRLTICESRGPKDNEMADSPELAKFRALYLEYAKAMLEATEDEIRRRRGGKGAAAELSVLG